MIGRRRLMQSIDGPAVEAAIARAERRSSAEVRVSVAPWFWGDVRRTAERAFVRLGLTDTHDRNAVLIFVVPARRSVVVLGDEGIHARVGQVGWDRIVAELVEAFGAGHYSQGLVAAIDTLGERLAEWFPKRVDDVDELPNAIDWAR